MRTVMKAAEVIHVWANQAQSDGRNPQGNCYFTGPTLYSYGRHYVVGRHVKGSRGRTAVLLNSNTSSPTTNRHRSHARQAVQHLTTFHVPLTDRDARPAEYMDAYAVEMRQAIELASKARGRKGQHFATAQWAVDQANRLAEFFGLRRRLTLPANLADAIAQANADRAAADRRNAKAIAERAKRAAAELERVRAVALAAVDDWRAGRISVIPGVYNYANLLGGDLLRLTGDGQTVQTSRGATVPAPHFRRAYRTLKRLHDAGHGYAANGHTLHVGHYQVSRMSGGMVRVGCHDFQWNEVTTFAHTAGLDGPATGPTTVADVPAGLLLLTDPDDVSRIKATVGPAADDFPAFFVVPAPAGGYYAEVWGVGSTRPDVTDPATRLELPDAPPAVPPAVQCPTCNGRGNVQGERCFTCQGYGVVTPATNSEGGAM